MSRTVARTRAAPRAAWMGDGAGIVPGQEGERCRACEAACAPSATTPQRPTVAELSRPDVEPPTGPAPDDLVIEDIVVGDGPEATPGSLVSAHYVGVTHDGGEQFDASWDRGDPLEFRLGVGMVIQGWDEGITGMKVGGRRRLTIPADKAYGERGAGGVIKPGATLVFVVDLVGVR